MAARINYGFRAYRVGATIYLCAAIGGLVAAIADLVQKESASAVVKFTSVAARHMQLETKPLWVMLAIVVLAALLCFVFQPDNRRTAFSIGIGVIAVLMTATPYSAPPTGFPTGAAPASARLHGAPIRLASADPDARLWRAAEPALLDKADLLFTVDNRTARQVVVTVSVYDAASGEVFAQRNALNALSSAVFPFQIPGNAPGTSISYDVSYDNLVLARAAVELRDGPTEVSLEIPGAAAASEGASQTRGLGGTLETLGRTLNKSYRW